MCRLGYELPKKVNKHLGFVETIFMGIRPCLEIYAACVGTNYGDEMISDEKPQAITANSWRVITALPWNK